MRSFQSSKRASILPRANFQTSPIQIDWETFANQCAWPYNGTYGQNHCWSAEANYSYHSHDNDCIQSAYFFFSIAPTSQTSTSHYARCGIPVQATFAKEAAVLWEVSLKSQVTRLLRFSIIGWHIEWPIRTRALSTSFNFSSVAL